MVCCLTDIPPSDIYLTTAVQLAMECEEPALASIIKNARVRLCSS